MNEIQNVAKQGNFLLSHLNIFFQLIKRADVCKDEEYSRILEEFQNILKHLRIL